MSKKEKKPKQSLLYRALFWTHLVAGVGAGLLILVLAATGFSLAFEPQVLDWAERGVTRVAVPEGAQRLSLEQLKKAALEATEAEAVSGFTLQKDPAAAVRLQLGREKAVYVDPYSGAVLGEGAKGWRAFFQWSEDLHRWLLVEGPHRNAAHQVKSAANVAFLILILVGPYLWWPKDWRWKNLKKTVLPNWRASGKARDFNWHNAFGVWAWPFIFIISLTGLVMSYPWASDLVYKISGNEPPPRQQNAPAGPGAMAGKEGQAKPGEGRAGRSHRPKGPGLEAYARVAQREVPEWISISFRQGRGDQDKVTLNIQTEDLPMPRGRGNLTLSAADASVQKWEPFDAQNQGRRWRTWIRWAHTGQAFGLLGQALAALAALATLVLTYTGLALSWRRFFGRKRA